jgi:signal transduction histidine kinase
VVTSTLLSSLSKISAAPDNSPGIVESSVVAKRILRTVRPALLVAISYYVGTRIGFAWTPIGQPNSTFWPANAILLSALLLTPERRWWTLLLAVLPTHMLAQLQAGVPVWTALGWFITNTSEALIGAFCIARFTHPKNTLDNVRGVFTFVVFGVVLAPLATSFLDAAAVVITGWGRTLWPLGVERFWTNALAELALVPAIVLWSSNGISWLKKARVAQYLEAALLAVGTVLVVVLVFGFQLFSPSTTPALLYLPLPFLLWAAARFGLGGLSLSLLSVALISVRYTMHGREPFPYVSMAENVLSLQILLCVIAVPLMFLSAVLAEARRTQDSLRRISGSLIEAQEQERHRIARELHDDVVQRLALLSLELEGVQEDIPDVAPELRTRIGALGNQTTQIVHDVQLLSHELHSSKVDLLGVAVAMKNFCEEFGERQKVEIDFRSQDLPAFLPAELSLSLFRVLQEALGNATKHSGVKRFEVRLWGTTGEIQLTISDRGAGFDTETAMKSTGLGLTSMQERLRLAHGELSINSKPKGGTTIHARVPFDSSGHSARAAG